MFKLQIDILRTTLQPIGGSNAPFSTSSATLTWQKKEKKSDVNKTSEAFTIKAASYYFSFLENIIK